MKQGMLILLLAVTTVAFGQKVKKATQQKTFAGMGGVFMNYLIELKIERKAIVEIDSIKTAVDTTPVQFSFLKDVQKISFGFPLSQPEKCRTCPDTDPKPVNTTKGVIIYGRKGEKRFLLKVKKFEVLPDLKTP